MGRRAKDLTGMDFGSLHVLHRCGSSPRGAALWECHCSRCGETSVIEGQRLIAGKTDCGCSYREHCADLTGSHIGVLEVLQRLGSDSSGNAIYLCRCDLCGQTKELPAHTIRSKLKSCGCRQYNPDRMREMSKQGISATIVNGINIPSVLKTEATKRNKLGIRGVWYDQKRRCYIAACVVHGEKWYGYGFDSAEAAKAARDAAQMELLAKYNIACKEYGGE